MLLQELVTQALPSLGCRHWARCKEKPLVRSSKVVFCSHSAAFSLSLCLLCHGLSLQNMNERAQPLCLLEATLGGRHWPTWEENGAKGIPETELEP